VAPEAELAGFGGELACVDLETTGGSLGHERVIEVGLVLLGARGREEWSTLVNPERPIPPAITAFTGISDAMVAGAPPFREIARELKARLAGRLFIAHNARFDYGFLRAEYARLGEPFRANVLCTVRLSRRLFPAERYHGLDALIARHALPADSRHRALGDARVLVEFLRQLEATVAGVRIEEALASLGPPRSLPGWLSEETLEALPESPGCYELRDGDGVLVAVGAAKNLRERVLKERARPSVAALSWQETVGEFGARLLEARARGASALARAPKTHTLELERGEGGLRVIAQTLEDATGGERYGLFAGARAAERALAGLVAGTGLCRRVLGLEAGSGACRAYAEGACRGACVGREPAALHHTRLRLALAPLKLAAWPFRGRVALVERDWRGACAWHVCAGWRHIASLASEDAARALEDPGGAFDPVVYGLLRRRLSRPLALIELD
jgi:DNA polymerase III subunit epsilon